MWALILRIAVALGKAEWAKIKAQFLAKRGMAAAEARARAVLDAAGAQKPANLMELRLIRSSADVFKPGMTIRGGDDKLLMVRRLLSGGASGKGGTTEFVYEVEVRG